MQVAVQIGLNWNCQLDLSLTKRGKVHNFLDPPPPPPSPWWSGFSWILEQFNLKSSHLEIWTFYFRCWCPLLGLFLLFGTFFPSKAPLINTSFSKLCTIILKHDLNPRIWRVLWPYINGLIRPICCSINHNFPHEELCYLVLETILSLSKPNPNSTAGQYFIVFWCLYNFPIKILAKVPWFVTFLKLLPSDQKKGIHHL